MFSPQERPDLPEVKVIVQRIRRRRFSMEESEAPGTVSPQEDPPPYSRYPGEFENDYPDSQPQQSRRASPLDSPPPTSTSRPFPTSWSLYHQPLTRVLMLGAHEDKPLYAVSHHTGWCGQPDAVLHNGPSDTLPMLAATQRSDTSGGGQYSIIVLPALPGSALDSSQEILRLHYNWPLVTFRFTVEIGTTPDKWTRESFEWRHSYKMVASTLDGVGDGWKLVRLSTIGPAGQGRGCSKAAAGDGAEIVAAWGYARKSLTKAMKFSFLGSRATGVLGDRWAIMAVMTALRMYQGQERYWNLL